MTIETKYNIGDEVWVMYDNKPYKDTIAYINFSTSWNGTYSLKYQLHSDYSCMSNTCYKQKEIFRTKQELIDSL